MSTTRRKFVKTVATAPLFSLMFGCETSSQYNIKPNILFFLIDDQRNDTLGCAGNNIIRTPHVDRLAKNGIRFENAFVTTSICAASRASILTSLHERTHQFTFGAPPIRAEYINKSYPMLLRSSGYNTGYIGKLGVKIKPVALNKMFDYFKPLGRHPYFHKMPNGSLRHETDLAADYAINFIKKNPSNTPFCLTVSFNAAHAEDDDKGNQYPWPPSADGLYDDVEIPEPKLSDTKIFDSLPGFLKESINRERYFWRWDTPEKYQKNMRAYYRMISGIDMAVGRLLHELKHQGIDDNTVIIYTADNGYYMGNRGFAGKWSHFDESLRVPLIVSDPRVKANQQGQRIDSMALNIDIPSLIVDTAGASIPVTYQGESLLPFVQGRMPSTWRTDFFCEHLMDYGGIPKWEGVRGERYVYARYFEQDPVYEFLHDLQKDPDELQNVAGVSAYRSVLETMRQRCDELKNIYISAR